MDAEWKAIQENVVLRTHLTGVQCMPHCFDVIPLLLPRNAWTAILRSTEERLHLECLGNLEMGFFPCATNAPLRSYSLEQPQP